MDCLKIPREEQNPVGGRQEGGGGGGRGRVGGGGGDTGLFWLDCV